MSGEIEAAGAAATAGLVAATLEGAEGRAGERHSVCANCGSALRGKFCQTCGQPARIHRSLGHLFEEVLHGVFHFDAKAWRTLPMLAFRPGTLTRNYTQGKRARYISPLALFLFSVFLLFFAFSTLSGVIPASDQAAATITSLREDLAEAEADIVEAKTDLAEAQAETGPGAAGVVTGAEAALRAAEDRKARAEKRLAAAQTRATDYNRAQAKIAADIAAAEAANDQEELEALRLRKTFVDRAVAADGGHVPGLEIETDPNGEIAVRLDLAAVDGDTTDTIFDEIKRAEESGDLTVNTGSSELDRRIRKKLQNPELSWYSIQNAASKYAFLLLPLSLPFVGFLFLFKKGVTFFDHAVFTLYSISFMTTLLIMLIAVEKTVPAAFDSVSGLAAIAIPLHMFFQLGGAYKLGWFSALWRTLMLMIFAAIVLCLFVAIIVVLGLSGG